MRVLALVTDAFGGYGGIAQYNRDFLTALAQVPGVTSVDVLTRVTPEALGPLPPGVQQEQAIYGKARYALRALALARRRRPDVVYSGHLYHGPLAALVARVTGARLISQLHGTEVWRPLRWRDLRPLAVSDLVFTVSRDTLGRLRDQAVVARRNGAVLANTVQPEFRPGNRAAARVRFGLHDDQKALLTVGRLDPRERYKGHDRVIRGLRDIRASGHEAVYLIAGIGDDRWRLEQIARDEGVADAVRFLGKVSLADLPDLYRAADLFVLPSTGEGFGICFLEAMACGTPALGLRAGGAPDALGDGRLGQCVDPESLVDAILAALTEAHRDPVALHDAVQKRFGMPVFRARVASLMARLKLCEARCER